MVLLRVSERLAEIQREPKRSNRGTWTTYVSNYGGNYMDTGDNTWLIHDNSVKASDQASAERSQDHKIDILVQDGWLLMKFCTKERLFI